MLITFLQNKGHTEQSYSPPLLMQFCGQASALLEAPSSPYTVSKGLASSPSSDSLVCLKFCTSYLEHG